LLNPIKTPSILITKLYNYKIYIVIMKKPKQQHINYSSVSKNENKLLQIIKQSHLNIFGVQEIQRLTQWKKNRIHNTLHTLQQKNLIKRIKRNQYIIAETLNEKIYAISTELIKPSYISFWTALSYYGFTEQQIKAIQIISTKQIKNININSYPIHATTYTTKKFYGYQKIENFIIATPEKTIIDSLYQPNKCGGFNEYIKNLQNAWKQLDQKKLFEYLIRFDNKSLISRIGFLIDQLQLEKNNFLEKLQEHKSNAPVKLNPFRQKHGKYNSEWNIIINQPLQKEEIK
jgi:predicted transcriptional regulator of viral defense system